MGPWTRWRCRTALIIAVAAAAAVVAGLWPSMHSPAWPGASLALVALGLLWRPGPIATRAPATLLATGALVASWCQIAFFWLVAYYAPSAMSHM